MNEFSSAEVGEIAGMRVLLAGEDRLGPETLTLPSGLSIVTENALPALVSACRTFDLEHLACLVAMVSAFRHDRQRTADMDRALQAEGAGPGTVLRDYQMAIVLRIALSDPERDDPGGQKATVQDLARLCRLVASSRCEADMGNATFSAPSFLLRTAYQQFWDLESLDSWPRGLIILREMAARMSVSDRYDINAAFARIYGLPFDTFVVLAFSLYALVTAQPGRRFAAEQFASSPDYDLPGEEVAAFLDLISSPLDQFRERASHPSVCFPGYDMYNLNPLMMWPAIRHSEGGVVVPIPRFLLDRVTTGVYFDFLLRLDDESAGHFGNFWGRAFEAYVGRIFETTPGAQPLTKADEVLGSGKVCDWILPSGSGVVLFECKTRGLDARSKITGQEDDLRRCLLKQVDGSSLAGGVAQLAESARRVREDPRFSKCTIFPVLVTLDEIYFANFDAIGVRALLQEGATRLTKCAIPGFQVSGVNGIEAVCRAVEYAGCDPVAALGEKFSDPKYSLLDMRTFVSRRFHPPTEPISLHRQFFDTKLAELVQPFLRRPTT